MIFFKVNCCRLGYDWVSCIFQLHSESFKLRRHLNGESLCGVCYLASSYLGVKEGNFVCSGGCYRKHTCFWPVMWKVLQEFLMSMLLCSWDVVYIPPWNKFLCLSAVMLKRPQTCCSNQLVWVRLPYIVTILLCFCTEMKLSVSSNSDKEKVNHYMWGLQSSWSDFLYRHYWQWSDSQYQHWPDQLVINPTSTFIALFLNLVTPTWKCWAL